MYHKFNIRIANACIFSLLPWRQNKYFWEFSSFSKNNNSIYRSYLYLAHQSIYNISSYKKNHQNIEIWYYCQPGVVLQNTYYPLVQQVMVSDMSWATASPVFKLPLIESALTLPFSSIAAWMHWVNSLRVNPSGKHFTSLHLSYKESMHLSPLKALLLIVLLPMKIQSGYFWNSLVGIC